MFRVLRATPEQQVLIERILAGAPGRALAGAGGGADTEGPNVYRLGRGYKCWHLVYQGKWEYLADERAVVLVEYLLKHPLEDPIHASDLENRVDGNPLADGAGGIERGEGDRGGSGSDGVGGVILEGAGKKLMGGEGLPFEAAPSGTGEDAR